MTERVRGWTLVGLAVYIAAVMAYDDSLVTPLGLFFLLVAALAGGAAVSGTRRR